APHRAFAPPDRHPPRLDGRRPRLRGAHARPQQEDRQGRRHRLRARRGDPLPRRRARRAVQLQARAAPGGDRPPRPLERRGVGGGDDEGAGQGAPGLRRRPRRDHRRLRDAVLRPLPRSVDRHRRRRHDAGRAVRPGPILRRPGRRGGARRAGHVPGGSRGAV
ncbi:MAG: hypothetical protein AVDCRST_MAG11-2793, partial [uncultured Gemmatimonadaceae bacterium]